MLRGHEKAVTSVVASLDGRLIASASSDGTVKVWKTTTVPHPGNSRVVFVREGLI